MLARAMYEASSASVTDLTQKYSVEDPKSSGPHDSDANAELSMGNDRPSPPFCSLREP